MLISADGTLANELGTVGMMLLVAAAREVTGATLLAAAAVVPVTELDTVAEDRAC